MPSTLSPGDSREIPPSYGYGRSDLREPQTDFRRFTDALKRRRWTVLGVLLAVLALVTVLSLVVPESFDSTVTFLVTGDSDQSNSPTIEVLERVGVGRDVETEVELVQSRRVVEAAISDLDISVDPEGGSNTARDAVLEVQERLDAEVVQRDGRLFALTCRGGSAADSHRLCEAVSSHYIRLRTDLERLEANSAASFLREQVELVHGRLDEAEAGLEDYRETNQIVALDERAVEGTRQLITIRAQREQLDAERAALADLIARAEADPRGPNKYRDLASFPTFLQNATVTQLLGTILELEGRQSDLLLTRSPGSPGVVALETRIEDLEQQLRSMAVSYERALASQIRSLDQTLSTYGRRLQNVPAQQIRLSQLEREVTLLDELYQFLETRRREAEVAGAVEMPSVHIVDAASLPTSPSFPNIPLNIALGLLLGLVAGASLAFVQETADTRFHEKGQLETGTGLGVLGLIPTVRKPGPLLPLEFRRHGPRELLVGPGGAPAEQTEDEPLPPVPMRPSSDGDLALEAFRSLIADLRFLGRDLPTGTLRTVAVTSAGPSEGKTFAACNLALARAGSGHRVLLVDADLRAAGVSRFLGVGSGPGLHELLADSEPLESATEQISVDGSDTLDVIPAGQPGSRSAAFIEHEPFEALLRRVEANYDLVVVDTPPLNVIADAASIAAAVDAVVVVVRKGITDKDGLQLTIERLSRTGVPIVSVVLNDVTLPKRYASYSYTRT